MAGEIREENLSLALRFIVDKYGKDALLNSKRVEGILSDLLPKSSPDINWSVDAIHLGVVKILLDENNTDEQSRKEAIQKAQEVFKRQYVAELRMNYILDNLVYALGWSDTKVDNLNVYEKNKKKKSAKPLNIKKQEPIKETQNNNILDDDNLNIKYVDDHSDENDSDRIKIKREIEYKNIKKNDINLDNQKIKKFDTNKDVNNYKPDDTKNNKKILLLLVIIAGLLLVFLGSKLFSGKEDVTVSNFTFSSNYELQGSTYIFGEGESVEMNIELDSKKPNKIDYEKLSYSVDNSSICNYMKESSKKCILIGMSKGNTILHIYYDGKKIKSLNIGFGSVENENNENISIQKISTSSNVSENNGTYKLPVGENVELQAILAGENIDYSKVSYLIDDSSMANVSDNNGKCNIFGNKEGIARLSILYDNKEISSISLNFENADKEDMGNNLDSNDEVDLVISGYLGNYPNAVNYGDISYVEGYITPSGKFHKELSTTLPNSYKKNIGVDVIGYTKNSMKYENGHYRVGVTVEYHVYKNGGTKYQKEYLEYIVVQQGGEWLIDRYINWQILQKYNL